MDPENQPNQQNDVEKEKHIPTHKELAEQHKAKGNQLFKNKKYESALQSYSAAISLNPSEQSYYSNRAICSFNLGDYQSSLDDAIKAIEINPQFVKGWRRKAMAEIQMLRFEKAVESFSMALQMQQKGLNEGVAAISKQKNEVESYLQNWKRYEKSVQALDYEEALKCINFLCSHVKSNIELKIKKVQCLAKVGQISSALTLFSSLSLANSHKAQFWYLKGLIELYNGNFARGKKFLLQGTKYEGQQKKCTNLIESYSKSQELKQQGNQLIKAQRYQQSYEKYTKAIQADPSNRKLCSILFSNRALCLIKQKKYPQALEDLNTSIKYDRKYLKSLIRRAEVFMKLQRYENALKDYEEIRKIDMKLDYGEKIQEAEKMLRASCSGKKNYYQVLGVEKNATFEEIRKKYKKMAISFNIQSKNKTEKSESESESERRKKWKEINEAFEIIGDPIKRQLYDSGEMVYSNDNESFDPNNLFQKFFGGGKVEEMAGAGSFPFSGFSHQSNTNTNTFGFK